MALLPVCIVLSTLVVSTRKFSLNLLSLILIIICTIRHAGMYYPDYANSARSSGQYYYPAPQGMVYHPSLPNSPMPTHMSAGANMNALLNDKKRELQVRASAHLPFRRPQY
jgi:hypothetical protein